MHGDDVLGFSAEARAGAGGESAAIWQQYRVCFRLLSSLSRAAGVEWVRPDDGVYKVYDAVMAGEMPCPIRRECPRYVAAVAAGKQFLWDGPEVRVRLLPRLELEQLSMF